MWYLVRRVRLVDFRHGDRGHAAHCSLLGIFSFPFFLLWTECCVLLSKFLCWNPHPQRDSIRRWGLWEVTRSAGEASVNGISVLKRRHTRQLASSRCFAPGEDTARRPPPLCQPGQRPHRGLAMLPACFRRPRLQSRAK